jgi:hypothetical protein
VKEVRALAKETRASFIAIFPQVVSSSSTLKADGVAVPFLELKCSSYFESAIWSEDSREGTAETGNPLVQKLRWLKANG